MTDFNKYGREFADKVNHHEGNGVPSGLISDLINGLTNTVGSVLDESVQNTISAITPVASTCLTLFIILWGWAMMRGMIQEPVQDALRKIVGLCLIYVIAVKLNYYNTFLRTWLWETPDALAMKIFGNYGSVDKGLKVLDQLLSRYDSYSSMWLGLKTGMDVVDGLKTSIIGVTILIVGVITVLIPAALIAISKIVLACLLIIGPIFVLLLMFQSTRKYFENWMGQCITCVLVITLTAVILSIMFNFLGRLLLHESLETINVDHIDYTAMFVVITLSGLMCVVMLQIQGIAASLGGGIAIGASSMVTMAVNMATRGYAALRNGKDFLNAHMNPAGQSYKKRVLDRFHTNRNYEQYKKIKAEEKAAKTANEVKNAAPANNEVKKQ